MLLTEIPHELDKLLHADLRTSRSLCVMPKVTTAIQDGSIVAKLTLEVLKESQPRKMLD